MSYITEAFDAIRAEIPDIDPMLLPLYALLILDQGEYVSMLSVHDAWSVWREQTNPEHRSLIPFEELSDEVQMLDWIYKRKLQRAAKALSLTPNVD